MIRTIKNAILCWYKRQYKILTIQQATELDLSFYCNIYGDEINKLNCRSLWKDSQHRVYRVATLFHPDVKLVDGKPFSVEKSQLRIGNYVGFLHGEQSIKYDKIWTLDYTTATLGGDSIRHAIKYSNIFGLSITSHYLVNDLGFAQRGNLFFSEVLVLEKIKNKSGWHVRYNLPKDNISVLLPRTLYCVHEIQNLHFELTGSELRNKFGR